MWAKRGVFNTLCTCVYLRMERSRRGREKKKNKGKWDGRTLDECRNLRSKEIGKKQMTEERVEESVEEGM